MGKRGGCFFIGAFISVLSYGQYSPLPPKDSLFSFRLSPFLQKERLHGLGFFCRKEEQLQKWAGLPLFLRLGTKEYVDYLERKPNARKRE